MKGLIMKQIISFAALDEATASVDQGDSIKRITWLTFVFLPLTFMTVLVPI